MCESFDLKEFKTPDLYEIFRQKFSYIYITNYEPHIPVNHRISKSFLKEANKIRLIQNLILSLNYDTISKITSFGANSVLDVTKNA